MRISLYTKTMLTLIVLLLATIARKSVSNRMALQRPASSRAFNSLVAVREFALWTHPYWRPLAVRVQY